eukprot:6624411-Prymnesium_polylepis.1
MPMANAPPPAPLSLLRSVCAHIHSTVPSFSAADGDASMWQALTQAQCQWSSVSRWRPLPAHSATTMHAPTRVLTTLDPSIPGALVDARRFHIPPTPPAIPQRWTRDNAVTPCPCRTPACGTGPVLRIRTVDLRC